MGLQYDFDIHWLIPQELTADPKIAKMMGDIGFNFDSRGNYKALFRSQDTIDALEGADPEVRAYFEESGFGAVRFDSGAGPGRFPRKDEGAMADVTGRLSDNIEKFDLKGKNWNGFDMAAFLNHIVSMAPVDMASPPPAGPATAIDDDLGSTPLDRVRRKHEAAARAAMSGGAEQGDALGGTFDEGVPDPDIKPMDDSRRRRAVAADRAFRIKQGVTLIAGAVILFVVAISQGQKIISAEGTGILTAAPVQVTPQDDGAVENPVSDETGFGTILKALSNATEADL